MWQVFWLVLIQFVFPWKSSETQRLLWLECFRYAHSDIF